MTWLIVLGILAAIGFIIWSIVHITKTEMPGIDKGESVFDECGRWYWRDLAGYGHGPYLSKRQAIKSYIKYLQYELGRLHFDRDLKQAAKERDEKLS